MLESSGRTSTSGLMRWKRFSTWLRLVGGWAEGEEALRLLLLGRGGEAAERVAEESEGAAEAASYE